MREFPRPVDETATPASAQSPGDNSRDVTWEVMSKHINDLIILSDLKGVISYASPSCRTFGYAQQDLIGRKAADFLHPEDLDYDPEGLARLASHDRGAQSRRERRFQCKDGSWVWLEGSPSVLEGAPGVPVARLNIFRDVTERRAVRDSLGQQAKRAAQAEAMAGLGYWRLDALTQEITWSEQMFRVYGLPQGDEPPLAAAMAMTHPDDLNQAATRLAGAMEHAEGWPDLVTRIVRPDGQVRHLHGRGVCEVDEAGRVTAVIGTVVDITDQYLARKAIVESERRYRLLTENTTDMISQTATDGRMIYLSPSVERMTGYSIAELLPRQMREFVHPDDLPGFLAFYGALISGRSEGGRAVRYRVRHKDGTWLWLESNPRLVQADDGTPTAIIDVTRDVTQQEQLKAQLSDALAAAEQAAAVKSEFVANMSHEIRTPLTAVLGFAALLSERRDLNGEAQGQIERIAGASRALLAVVNDVLDFSKLEAGEVVIRRRPASPEQAAREVLDMFALQASAKGIDLRFDAAIGLPNSLLIDDDRLRQILINLVGNAVKFTDNGRVCLSLSYGSAEGLVAEVTDTGAGISPREQTRLFQRFSQIDGSSGRSKGGTGLGLAICMGLAEAMGGSVTLRSQMGRGSVFRLTVPALRAASASLAGTTQEDLAQLCGLRVLVADDNAVNRELVRAILEPAGVEVSEAIDGRDAVEVAQTMPFDAILMDLRMPGLDGRAALALLRGEPGPNQQMPILAFSADGALDAATASVCGFQGVVRKPTSPPELLQALIRATDPTQEIQEGMLHVAAG